MGETPTFVELCHCSFGFYNSNEHYSRTQKNIIPLKASRTKAERVKLLQQRYEGIFKLLKFFTIANKEEDARSAPIPLTHLFQALFLQLTIYNSIKDIHPETRNWIVKVLVVEKTMTRTSTQGVIIYQRLILINIEGNRVQVVQFGRGIQLREYTLIQARMYFITHTLVKLMPTRLRLVDHNYQWIINTTAVIEDVLEHEILFHTTNYSFVPFDSTNTSTLMTLLMSLLLR
ncbi:hypothetical protein CMV_029006 [Castanea mollissima]|uniref:Uncharacterized protein n=1 Tax=Castanea mollissima TaxID=60419 RepID=A0A8J4Q751_9ROSI|nr:hypothetical protein CMV_029006 [Castanea mollissima]